MRPVIFNVSLFAFVLIGYFIFLVARKMDKMRSFRKLPGCRKEALILFLILIAVIISAFSFDIFDRYEHRITMLAICIFPVILIHGTFGRRSIKRDMDNTEDASDMGRMMKYSRVLSRACLASYLVYLPFTLSYLQII